MLGFLNDEIVLKLLSSTKLMLFPSREEGYGMAIAEALALGCTVISYDLPVLKKEFGNKIIKVPCYNLDIFAHKVVNCLNSNKGQTIDRNKIRSWELASKEEFKIIEKYLA